MQVTMVATTATTGIALASRQPLFVVPWRPNLGRAAAGTLRFAVKPLTIYTATAASPFIVRSSDPRQQEAEEISTSHPKSTSEFTFKEDWEYLWRLGVGSVVGAAVIKYGSLILPEITKPNVVHALIIIFSPVVAAVLILVKQSREEEA